MRQPGPQTLPAVRRRQKPTGFSFRRLAGCFRRPTDASSGPPHASSDSPDTEADRVLLPAACRMLQAADGCVNRTAGRGSQPVSPSGSSPEASGGRRMRQPDRRTLQATRRTRKPAGFSFRQLAGCFRWTARRLPPTQHPQVEDPGGVDPFRLNQDPDVLSHSFAVEESHGFLARLGCRILEVFEQAAGGQPEGLSGERNRGQAGLLAGSSPTTKRLDVVEESASGDGSRSLSEREGRLPRVDHVQALEIEILDHCRHGACQTRSGRPLDLKPEASPA